MSSPTRSISYVLYDDDGGGGRLMLTIKCADVQEQSRVITSLPNVVICLLACDYRWSKCMRTLLHKPIQKLLYHIYDNCFLCQSRTRKWTGEWYFFVLIFNFVSVNETLTEIFVVELFRKIRTGKKFKRTSLSITTSLAVAQKLLIRIKVIFAKSRYLYDLIFHKKNIRPTN